MYDPELFDAVYESPVGWLGIRLQGGSLKEVNWIERPCEIVRRHLPYFLVKNIITHLDAYFTKASSQKIPALAPGGTVFQQRVRGELLKIPFGSIKTYGQLAAVLKTSNRAIGQACRRNPIAILIPCHRVVAAGDIGGYMGNGHIHIKRWLLEHEGVY